MSREQRRGPMGRGHGHGMGPGEKAKDFKGTIRKLIRYMSVYKIQMLFVLVFAVGGTIFNILGPKILGKATTEIFNGLVGKVSGTLRGERGIFLYPGLYHDRDLPEDDLPFPKGDLGKDQQDAHALF